MKKIFFFIALLLLISGALYAQVGINTDGSNPDPSAGLDVKFNNKGLLPPRVSQVQRDAIVNPAEGLIVICTDCGLPHPAALSIYIDGAWRLLTGYCTTPGAPTAATHNATLTQIIWNWNTVTGALGYKWNITNNISTATDMGTATTKTETGLTCNTPYTRYVWAYNACGVSTATTLTQTTSVCFTCGASIPINHTAGVVAPVNKTVTYGTVTNIPGETTKCWITRNLGASQQATAVDDATESSAGWYWQFNRKQGFKHDGTTRTPATTWINSIVEPSDWIPANDPCTLELGSGWRLPVDSEWYNVDNVGNWTNWNGPWNSGLKMHAAGYLYAGDGSLSSRGSYGLYWSSTLRDVAYGWYLNFSSGNSNMYDGNKANGFTLRCLRD